MKTPDQIKPNFAPVYAAAMYPDLAKIFQRHGYALAVHGSLARDMDLIAIPWVETVSPPLDVLRDVTTEFAVTLSNNTGDPSVKPHGRTAFTLIVGWGHCQIDIGFMAISRLTSEPKRDATLRTSQGSTVKP